MRPSSPRSFLAAPVLTAPTLTGPTLAAPVLALLLGAAALGCDNGGLEVPPDSGVTADLVSSPSSDLAASADLAGIPPGDLDPPRDLAVAPDAGYVVCNLGQNPLACTGDGVCAPLGARCDANRRSCVCITPNCTPGADQTCNSDPVWSSIHGQCTPTGACLCLNGNVKEMVRGKCL